MRTAQAAVGRKATGMQRKQMGKGLCEILHLQLAKLYICIYIKMSNWWKFYKALWIPLILDVLNTWYRMTLVWNIENLKVTVVWGRCNVFFLTIVLPFNMEKASLHVKNNVVLEDLHRKITEVKRQRSTNQRVLVSHSEIFSQSHPWRRGVRASSWIWEAAGIGPKALPVTPPGCRVPCWWGVCHPVGTQRGPEQGEGSTFSSMWKERNILTSRPG